MEKDKRDPNKTDTKRSTIFQTRELGKRLKQPATQIALLVLATSLGIALLLSPSFSVSSPDYQLGDVVGHNIKAKRDFLVLDEKATQRKRREASNSAPLVFDFDQEAAARIEQKVTQAFVLIRRFLNSQLPSASGILFPDRSIESRHFPPTLQQQLAAIQDLAYGRKKAFEASIGFRIPMSIYTILVNKQFSADIVDRVRRWQSTVMTHGVISNRRLPFELHAQTPKYVIRKLPSKDEELVPTMQFYRDLQDAMAFIHSKSTTEEGDPEELEAAAYLTTQLLEPNIVFNRVETAYRKGQAGEEVKPVYIQVKKNEMMVREGQRIGPEQLLKLQAYRQSAPERHQSVTFLALFLFSAIYCFVLLHVSRQHLPTLRLQVKDILFLALILICLLLFCRVSASVAESFGEHSGFLDPKGFTYGIPLAAGAMLVTLFFDITASLIFSVSLSLFAGILFGSNFDLFVYFLVGSFVGVHGMIPCRNRLVPIRAGIFVGLANVVLLLILALLQNEWHTNAIFTNLLLGFMGGVIAGVLVTGFTPLAELLFGYTTDIKLLELASMDQPLLQELMVQAPGTYHHSIIVGNMVETAARSIGANSLLAKVSAYYHDIGKTRKPVYFIENQLSCENRHEKLAPSMSALILISHVKEGIELARKNRLGKPIRDIISQHHGTSLISFFYQKALATLKKTRGNRSSEHPPINVEDYRYPGPKPQTKEAGLVMLADVVEAACRSLADPTPARIQGMVSRLINGVFSDGQLDECELTLKDLHRIAKHFNQILASVHHKRIQYPGQTQGNHKGKQVAKDPNQRESGTIRNTETTIGESGQGDLKRLGLH